MNTTTPSALLQFCNTGIGSMLAAAARPVLTPEECDRIAGFPPSDWPMQRRPTLSDAWARLTAFNAAVQSCPRDSRLLRTAAQALVAIAEADDGPFHGHPLPAHIAVGVDAARDVLAMSAAARSA